MLDHLRPQYARNFRCIGSRCAENCCRGWDVLVDRETYQKYEAHPTLRSRLADCFMLITQNASQSRYALIKCTASSVCPFLSEERLCQLQQEYGEEYLSQTCANYPRMVRRVDGLPESPLCLSCPEAARLVLLDPHLMPQDARSGESRYAGLRGMKERDGSCNPLRHLWDIREFSLLLVRDRAYPLWQRLFLLGRFCQRLDEILGGGQAGLVPRLVAEYAEILGQGKLRPAMDGLPVRADVQVEMVLEFVFRCLAHKDPRLSRIHDCLAEFLHGIGYDTEPYRESCTRRYTEACAYYYSPLMTKHPHLLENYLINHIFRTQFPFGCNLDGAFGRPQEEYVWMCLEYAMIKGLLIGLAGHYRETFGVDHVVTLVHRFARAIEHSPGVRDALNTRGLVDANCIAALLAN